MILITGATGTVGGEVLKQAAAARLPLRAAYRSADKARGAPAGVDTVTMDYARPETIRPALDGVAAVFLLSPAVANLAALETNVVCDVRDRAAVRAIRRVRVARRSASAPTARRPSAGR